MVLLVDSLEGISELPQYPISYLSCRKTHLPIPSENSNQVEDCKSHNDNHQKQKPTDLSPLHLLWVRSCQEDNTQGTVWTNAFLTERRKTQQDQWLQFVWVYHGGFLPITYKGHRVMDYTQPLMLPVKTPFPSHDGAVGGGGKKEDTLVQLAKCHIMMFTLKEIQGISLCTQNKGKVSPNKKESRAKQLLSTCFPYRGMFQAQCIDWAFLKRGSRSCQGCFSDIIPIVL